MLGHSKRLTTIANNKIEHIKIHYSKIHVGMCFLSLEIFHVSLSCLFHPH